MGYLLAALVVLDGVVTRNPQPWAAPIRAAMLVALLASGVILLRRSHVLSIPAALMLGVLSAMTISEAYHAPSIGLWLWCVYAGSAALQSTIQLDWRNDLALCGSIVSVLFIVATLAAGYPVGGAWNKNVIAGVLLVTLPAATQLSGRARPVMCGLILAGILISMSRGAMGGAFVALAVLFQPWALVAFPVLGAGLLFMRSFQSSIRLPYWSSGLSAMLSSMFGVGPGRLLLPSFDVGRPLEIHAHNSIITIGAQVGLVGVVVAALVAMTGKPAQLARWQWATLAGVAVQAMVDDPLFWLPVGVMLAFVAFTKPEAKSRESV